MNEIEVNSKPRRAQGGKGLLSRSSSVQKTQNPMVQLLLLEKRGREQREGQRGRLEEMRVASGSLAPGTGELAALLSLLTPLTL